MQISRIQTRNSYDTDKTKKQEKQNFKGALTPIMNGVGRFFQVCDEIPMIGVSFTDTVATNVPRTVVDLKQTGVPAAAETARREFSGLFVNCLVPGAFVWGAAKATNNALLSSFKNDHGKIINLSDSWADEEAVSNLIGVWKEQSALLKNGTNADKIAETFNVREFIKGVLNKVEGLEGVNNWKKLSDKEALVDGAASILEPYIKKAPPKSLIKRFAFNRRKNNALKEAYNLIVKGEIVTKENAKTTVKSMGEGLKAAQTLKFDGKSIGSDLKNLLRDTVDIGGILASSSAVRKNPDEFVKKAGKFISAKSLIGLGIIIPIAMSMQKINRAITKRKYKKSGAPIYKNFEKENRVLTEKEKKQLAVTKPLAVSSIIGLAALSMKGAFPKSLKDVSKMLQFNTKFPTLNQCRVIATATFASRMLSSEDPNELREGTVRDLASFAGLYFLGDYAEKLAATAIQKFSKAGRSGGLNMFNKTKDPSEYKNLLQKFAGWVEDTSIKSFDEIPAKFKNRRSLAKLGGLGFSIAFLGVLLPMYNKHVTNKKEAKRKALLEKNTQNKYSPNLIFPDKNQAPIYNSRMPQSTLKQWQSFSRNKTFGKIASRLITK